MTGQESDQKKSEIFSTFKYKILFSFIFSFIREEIKTNTVLEKS